MDTNRLIKRDLNGADGLRQFSCSAYKY